MWNAPSRRAQLKMLAAACGLLLAVVAATWGYVYAMSERTVNAALAKDLERAQGLVMRVHEWRLERLQLTARLLASFPELKALFEATDAATIRDFLVTYQQRNPGTPLLVALGPSGTSLGRTDASETVGDLGRRLADRPGRAARRADGRVRRRPLLSRRGRGRRSRRQAVRIHRRGGAGRSGVCARDQRSDRRRDRPLVATDRFWPPRLPEDRRRGRRSSNGGSRAGAPTAPRWSTSARGGLPRVKCH